MKIKWRKLRLVSTDPEKLQTCGGTQTKAAWPMSSRKYVKFLETGRGTERKRGEGWVYWQQQLMLSLRIGSRKGLEMSNISHLRGVLRSLSLSLSLAAGSRTTFNLNLRGSSSPPLPCLGGFLESVYPDFWSFSHDRKMCFEDSCCVSCLPWATISSRQLIRTMIIFTALIMIYRLFRLSISNFFEFWKFLTNFDE